MADPLLKPTGREAVKDEMATELNHSDGDRLVETGRPLDELGVELKNLGGDCIKVMQLLKADSSLLKDRALPVLHLGVSRGCIQIVEQVVKFYMGENSLADGSERGLEKDVRQNTKATEDGSTASCGDEEEDILGESSELSQQGVKSSREKAINAWSDNKDAPTVALDELQIQIDDKNENSDPDYSHCQDDSFRGTAAGKGTTGRQFLDFVDYVDEVDEMNDEDDELLDFDELLCAKYSYSGPALELSALEVGVVNGNLDVIALLLTKTPRASRELHRNQLIEITERVVEIIRGHSVSRKICPSVFDALRDDPEFNFLFWDVGMGQERVSEYLFHFLFTQRGQQRYAWGLRRYLWREVWDYQGEPREEPLWKFLLRLHDAQGRTPLHVAVDEGTVEEFFSMFDELEAADHVEVFAFAMEATDGLGRTPWHRAVLRADKTDSVNQLAEMLGTWASWCRKKEGKGIEISVRKKFEALSRRIWQHPMEGPASRLEGRGIADSYWPVVLDIEYGRSKFRQLSKTTPLHGALLHGPMFAQGLWYGREIFSPKNSRFRCRVEGFEFCEDGFGSYDALELATLKSSVGLFDSYEIDALELATLTSNVGAVKDLLKSGEQGSLITAYTSKQSSEWGTSNRYGWVVGDKKKKTTDFLQLICPAIHIAAYSANYEMLKVFIGSKICDPYIEDDNGCTVLHAVLDPKALCIQGDVTDFANVKYIPPNYVGPPAHKGTIAERQDCINLLLQSGCDIFKVDNNGQAPYPKGDLRQNQSCFSWWNDRQLKEFTANQNSMSFATNAISVMATLVATASYVGPLQPPLGYSSGDGPNQIQAKYIWVRIFIVCDTLSFYLAIAAITFSLIPALPMPQQAMAAELQKTMGMIILAVATLFPSIVCILLAFAAGSIVVIRANGISSLGGNLTIITGSMGGLICLIGFLFLFIRLLGIMFPRVRQVRKLYDLTSFFFEGKGITIPTVAWIKRMRNTLTRYWR